MSSAPTASLLVLLTLAVVLAVSAVAKMRDPLAVEDALVSLRVPSFVPRGLVGRGLPWAEGALALLLLASPSAALVVVAALVTLLMAVYTWLIARALTFEDPVECACFGTLASHVVDRVTLARNVLLLGLSGVAVAIGVAGGSVWAAATDLGGVDWWTLLAALAAVTVAAMIVRHSDGGAAPAGEPELDYERTPIPYGVLTMPDGTSSTLVELAATQARLLVVLKEHCGACVRTAEKLDSWAEQLAPAVGLIAVHGEPGLDLPHSAELTMIEPQHNVRRIFSVGAPGAVLLGADGLMAGGPVAGAGDVERFVAEILEELGEAPV
ncbi:hypothetical protein J2X46_001118 [Nocardioides sp. BE266]|uniref:MauE/DoxX family redox-associated membrane protein n=1 Tax=Nocardioides sp. BE266 TaxID=2817725 RepID=UPI00285F02FD|nr:MauE/DoxX family redox-associated membrane protein [Nocardioides sp. BE266]MDR7252142.1 hypothetical protein [Nocardioides sp. BE266]